jgi:hypothetical protein
MTSAQRWVAALLVAVLPAAVGAADAGPMSATVQRALPCQAPTLTHDRLQVVCTLDASRPQRLRVAVHFTGSHDDTTAALEVSLGGVPVVCDSGSKTSSEYEDGDVSLECRWTTPAAPGAATQLRVAAKWFHAHYLGFEVGERTP